MNLMGPVVTSLKRRRIDEMEDLRTKARNGNKRAARELVQRCRMGMLVPGWER